MIVVLSAFSLNTLVLGVSLTASTSPEEGHAGNQQMFGPSGATTGLLFLRGSPRFLGGSPKSPLKCLGAPRGRFSLPRKLILGSINSGGLLCLRSLPGLICLLRLLCLLRCLSIFCSFACYDCCAYFLALLTLLALLSLLAFLMCLGPRILTSCISSVEAFSATSFGVEV